MSILGWGDGMLDIEIASAMRFLIEAAGNPHPYYYNISENFIMPAVFLPQPEISTRGDTLKTYALEFSWFVKFFAKDDMSAHSLAFAALTALKRMRNDIPLIDETGTLTGRSFNIKDPSLRRIDDGAVQLTLTWDSPRPYFEEESQKVMATNINMWAKSAFESAINRIGGHNGR
jgi:hypothetical protein